MSPTTDPTGQMLVKRLVTPLRPHDTLVLHAVFPPNGWNLYPLVPLRHGTPTHIGTFKVLPGLYVLPFGNPDTPGLHVVAEALLEPHALDYRPYQSTSAAVEWLGNCLPPDFLIKAIDQAVHAAPTGRVQFVHNVPADSRELFNHVRQHFRAGGQPREEDCPRAWFLLGAPFPPLSETDH